MNTALKATSVRDLKDAARAIQFVLKNQIKGKAAVAALCDLLEVTARTVREESAGYVPHAVRKAGKKQIAGDTRYVGRNQLPPLPLEPTRCCICCGELGGDGHGHNASPVADGRCCGTCNDYAVIPARIANLYRAEGRPVRG